MLADLNHKHILVTANGLSAPPTTAVEVESWLRELIDLVGMKILMGPYATYCDTAGNEGVTGIVCIETSHCSIHVWNVGCVPFAKMDLYSCKDFSVQTVLDHFARFAPDQLDYMVVDRNSGHSVIEMSHNKPVDNSSIVV